MTTPAFEGAWRRMQLESYGTDPERFTVATAPDPSHGDSSEAPPPLMMDAPTATDASGEIHSDVWVENFHLLPEPYRIDTTPVEGHGTPEDSGHGYGGVFIPTASEWLLGAARGQDCGADKRATSSTTVYQKADETFGSTHTVGFEPPPITRMANNPALIRGINGYDVNNGPQARPTAWTVNPNGAWKRGDYEQSFVQRNFRAPSWFHRPVKVTEADIVTIIGDAPPPRKSDTYASPWSALQKFAPKRRKVRGIRRDPGPWDESQQAYEPPIYGLSADGMVVL